MEEKDNKKVMYVCLGIIAIFLVLIAVGRFLPDPPEPCSHTCNGTCYNPRTQSCCQGAIIDGDWIDLHDGTCRNNNFSARNTAEWYCGGVVYHIDDDIRCCNGTAYNELTEHCCNGTVRPGGGLWFDCGNSCYNVSTQSCCHDRVYEGTDRCCDSGGVVCPSGEKCCNVTGRGPTCYDPEKSRCWAYPV